jgi:polysaccharide biosynthesis transport protein
MNENLPDEINLMDYIYVIRKRKWIIILGTLICMAAAGVVSFSMPKIYEAMTYLMVTSPKYNVEFATKEGSKFSTPFFENVSAETFSKIIINENTARTVLDKLRRGNPDLKYTASGLLGQVRVEYPRNTNLMVVKAQDTSRDRAARIANTWASVFIEKNEEVISSEATSTFNFVMDQLEKAKVALKASEDELERFQKENRIDLLKEQIAGKINQIVSYQYDLDDAIRAQLVEEARRDELVAQIMVDLNLKISQAEINLEKERIALEETKSEIQKENKHIPVDKGMIGKEEINPLYLSLSSRRANTAIRITMLEIEKTELLRTQRELEREIRKKREDAVATKRIGMSFKGELSQLPRTPDPDRQRAAGYATATNYDLKQALINSEIDIQTFKAEILQLKRNVTNLDGEIAGLKKILAEQELIQTRFMRNVETARSTFEILARKGEETKISSAIKVATVQIAVPATSPDLHIKPRKAQNVMIAGVVGFLASILLVFFLEFLQNSKVTSVRPNPKRGDGLE